MKIKLIIGFSALLGLIAALVKGMPALGIVFGILLVIMVLPNAENKAEEADPQIEELNELIYLTTSG